MSRSISFDPAAEYYDRTRALPPDIQARVTSLLARELSGRGPCLEVGIGTGRMALPLRGAGAEMIGIDLSLEMLLRLREKAGAQAIPAARADATQLPFPDHTFGAALACHVLHLIPDWRRAAAEMVRVTRPGGVVLIDRGGGPQAWRELTRRFFQAAGDPRWPVGLNRHQDLDAVMAALGTAVRTLDPIESQDRGRVGPRIDSLEQGIFAACWDLEPEALRRAAAETRRWAVERYGSLEAEVEVTHSIVWRAYDLPSP
ncbi:MAG TPA: class I SAM-dependent methyltransferase [Candidatus Acidoferrales bacterium]|nr:class I SAM-dependent methyltransferase [Candidatus Acidoferrales bacterium]